MAKCLSKKRDAASELSTITSGLQRRTQSVPPSEAHVSSAPVTSAAPQRIQRKRKATSNGEELGACARKAITTNSTGRAPGKFNDDNDDDDEEYWDQMTAKHGNVLPIKPNPDDYHDIDLMKIRSTPLAIPILKTGAWTPNAAADERWHPLSDIDSKGGNSIHARFMADFAFNDVKRVS